MARTYRLVIAAYLGIAVGVLSFACQSGVYGEESKNNDQLAESGTGSRILLGMNLISYTEDPGDKDLEESRSLGVQAVRIWVHWRAIEAKKGEFAWSSLDKAVALCEQKGIEPWFLVVGAPQHACRGGQLDETLDRLCPPQIEPYKIFLKNLVERYRGRVRHYEIWNEQDLEIYWITGPNASEYAELLRVSYSLIKKVDEKAQVVMGATGGTNLPFMREMLDHLKGEVAFDAVASHPYRWSDETGYSTAGPYEQHSVALPEGGDAYAEVDLKEELLLYENLLENYGYKNIPHWITEYGYPAHDDVGGKAYVTLSQQADYLEQTYFLLRDDAELSFVRGVFWFCDRDWATDPNDPSAQDDFGFFGLLKVDHTWKPAAYVFRDLAASLHPAEKHETEPWR